MVSYADVYRLMEDKHIRLNIVKNHQPRHVKGNLVYSTNSIMGFKDKYPCCFLENNKCSIYRLRPQICRIFPFIILPDKIAPTKPFKIISTRTTPEGENLHLTLIGLSCPGVGRGREIDIDKLFEIGLEDYRDLRETYSDQLLSNIPADTESLVDDIE